MVQRVQEPRARRPWGSRMRDVWACIQACDATCAASTASSGGTGNGNTLPAHFIVPVGIPDLIFALSVLVVAWLAVEKESIETRGLILWNVEARAERRCFPPVFMSFLLFVVTK